MKIIKVAAMVVTMIIILFGLLTIGIPYIRYANTSPASEADASHVKSVGHRGAAAHAPENTLAGFSAAMQLGVDFIEMDIHLTKDNHVVVLHDTNTKRTTGYDAEVNSLTLEEVQELDAGSWFGSAFTNERIPTLAESLALIKGQCQVLIEIKWPKSSIYEQIVTETLKVIDQQDASSWVILQSFESRYLQEAHQKKPSIRLHQLLFGDAVGLPVYQDRALRLGKFSPVAGVTSVNTYYLYLHEQMKEQYGVSELGVFTVNDEAAIAKSIANGATYIISDKPELVRQYLDGLK